MELTQLDVSHPTSSLADGIDEETSPMLADGIDEETSPMRGPPSETSSQEWDKVTDAGSHTPA